MLAAEEGLQSVLEQAQDYRVRVAKLELQNAEQKLQQTKQQLARADVYSPATGIIFASVEGEENKEKAAPQTHLGSPVARNAPMFAVANTEGIAIDAQVSETQVLQLKRGQPAKVVIEALPDTELDGVIQFVAGRGVADSSGSGGPKFKVTVRVAEVTEPLRRQIRIGMSAAAKVVVYENPQALVIPFEAVTVEGPTRLEVLKGIDLRVKARPACARPRRLPATTTRPRPPTGKVSTCIFTASARVSPR